MTDTQANPMWGGRFEGSVDALMEAINASIDFDKYLYEQDIAGSIAHCQMLVAQDIITGDEGKQILDGLARIKEEIAAGKFQFKPELEDIHMNIESRLADMIGDVAGKLHTARSRNDQVATDFRLWVRKQYDTLDNSLKKLQEVLLKRAEEHADTIMPGFTHLQTAQPITLGHHLLAYVDMFGRDRGRVQDARKRMNECPLGAAALAGTSFAIDRGRTAEALGFDRPVANSLDAVSDRDFALEFLTAASLCASHLSRLAEEIVIWASADFGFVSLSSAFSSGSSIMPQKRNPDAAELVRAKTGRVLGALVSLLTVMKGLPLAYSKDMQEDKEPVFDAAKHSILAVQVMEGMMRDMTFHKEAMHHAAGRGFSTATDLADWLVRELQLPFRKAHHVVGKIVALAEEKCCTLDALTLSEMQGVEAGITEAVFSVLSVEHSVASRGSYGGTAPHNVRAAITEAKTRYQLD